MMERQPELALALSLQHMASVVPSSLCDSFASGGFPLPPPQHRSTLLSSRESFPTGAGAGEWQIQNSPALLCHRVPKWQIDAHV